MPQSTQKHSNTAALIEPYLAELKAFFVSRAGSQAADELIQRLNLRLLRHPPRELLRCPKGFLYRVASFVLSEHRRLERTDRERFIRGEDAERQVESVTATDFVSGLEAADELRAILRQLPERQADALTLLRCDGLSYAEIAEELGISVHTIKKDIARAIVYVNSKHAGSRKRS